MDFDLEGERVIIPLVKGVLVLTREEFIRGLRRGKRYRRIQAQEARRAKSQAENATKTLYRPEVEASEASGEVD